MKHLLIMLCFAGTAFIQAQAQDSTKEKLKAFVEGRHYIFEPVSTTTGKGRTVQLDPGYYFEVNGDTLKVYLPYFGQAYSAPMNTNDVGFKYNTTSFSYDAKEGKKDSYDVNVKIKGQSYDTDFTLTVYDNGTAYLSAYSNNRQRVSYRGNIRAKQ